MKQNRGPYNIGGLTFRTQAEIIAHCRSIIGQGDGRVPDEHAAFLFGLLDRHPGAAEKIGVGVDHFEIARGAKQVGAGWIATRGFYVVRVDGSRDDFSFMKCVRG
jgi:hypothetical protein